jgi:1,4-dihydroxy-2-naphthoate octaprenyltransferase
VAGAGIAVPLVALVGDRPAALLALVAAPLAVPPLRTVLGGARGPALIPVLVATGRLHLAAGALFALGLWLSS